MLVGWLIVVGCCWLLLVLVGSCWFLLVLVWFLLVLVGSCVVVAVFYSPSSLFALPAVAVAAPLHHLVLQVSCSVP